MTDRRRSGYVIVNNKGSKPAVITVMDDDLPLDSTDQNQRSARLTRRKKLVVHRGTQGITTVSYIGQPFCSLLECSTKSRLLSANFKIAKLNLFGDTDVALIFSPPKNPRDNIFCLFLKSYNHQNGPDFNVRVDMRCLNQLDNGNHPNQHYARNYIQIRLRLHPPSTFYPTMQLLLNRINTIVTDNEFLDELFRFKQQVNSQRARYFQNNV